MNILVINCGSSSLKYQLLDMPTATALAAGLIERIGESQGLLTHKNHPDTDGETKIERGGARGLPLPARRVEEKGPPAPGKGA